MTPARRRLWRSLARDERGNVSVMFVFGAMLLVAMVLGIGATGQKLVQRETLQNSADAAALAGAVVKAKALNYVAFCNLVLAALLAIDVVLRGVAFGLQLFLPIASSLCGSHHYDYCAYLPHATQVQMRYQMAAQQMESMMAQLARGERTVAAMAPALAVAESYRAGTDQAFQRNYGSGLSVTTVAPSAEALPVEDESSGAFFEHSQDPFGKIEAIGLVYLHLVLGDSRPGKHAFGMSVAGVQMKNSPGTVPSGSLPLKLSGGWKERRFFRTVSSLGDTDVAWRRKQVGVAALKKSRESENQTLGSAQAEFFAFNGHADLWHVDWRARLSLSTPFLPIPEGLRQFWVH
ncbi:MAG: hypothetical protein JWN44_1953 [Myxococcales bacterium]|nr:hypothetical protein [Myxococcales bacterium]